MKRFAFALGLTLAIAGPASASIHGAWTITTSEKGTLYLQASRSSGWNNWGMSMKLTDFSGLSEAQIRSTTQVPVQFALRSEAGAIVFDGTFRNGDGAGQFDFTAAPGFFQQVRALGVTIEPREKDRSEEDYLFRYTLNHLTLGYVREMHSIYPDATLHELYRLRSVGVTPQWLREMREAGVKIESAQDAKRLAGSGVNAAYVRELAASGYRNLTVRQLSRLRASGVDAKFIRDLSGIQ